MTIPKAVKTSFALAVEDVCLKTRVLMTTQSLKRTVVQGQLLFLGSGKRFDLSAAHIRWSEKTVRAAQLRLCAVVQTLREVFGFDDF